MFQVKNHKPMPLVWWNSQQEKIDTDPPYQRRSKIWSQRKQVLLIDSLINNYDMPKLYLADFSYVSTKLNKKKKLYAVIDGKQRLQAIFNFFGDKLPLHGSIIFEADETVDLGGLTYSELKQKYPEIAAKIENHVPSVMSVITDEKSKINELFVRLNSGVQANGPERRNAMPGMVPELIRKLVTHSFFTKKIFFDVLRMSDFNVAAKLLLIEFKNQFVDTKASNLDRFVMDAVGMNSAPYENAEKQVWRVLAAMSKIFQDRDPLLKSAGAIPLYYWLVRNDPRNRPSIRGFLEQFTEKVKENHRIIKEDPNSGDPELANYYTMGRTTNDQGSLSGRYAILEKRFEKFLMER